MTPRKPHIFSRIFDFGYQRTKWQAVGFYFAHLMLYLVLSGVILGFFMGAGLTGGDVPPDAPDIVQRQVESAKLLGPILGLLHALVLVILVLKQKGLERHGKMVGIGALAMVLGGLGGPLLSLLAISWLTTRASVAPIEVSPDHIIPPTE